ncbi:hypothetical protein A1507_02145 [Methylomonas koyamae]|uniref:Uncharacterized protein n=1 Tax=Methylomonas koyamae TaxID=702114 RepID=A0A177N3R7_9GAMM|nr:hypothetical protein [Methylomonas koyamae]OAI12314.1 hypothetical protein A1507_02145 [Methylomonas koyamae]
MKITVLATTALLAISSSMTTAGTLGNGTWVPAACGTPPETPVVDESDVDAFNKSIAAINTWQQKSRDYFECMIKEANADNATIADSANQAQAKYRETVEKVGAQADAAKKKLDK